MMFHILITGANKGIGRGLVEAYAARPNTTIIATVRRPESDEAQNLLQSKMATGSKIMLVKVEATSDTDVAQAVQHLQQNGIGKLDLVIANAAIFTLEGFKRLDEAELTEFTSHFNVNFLGPLRLFQATKQLLEQSPQPRFVVVSSMAGTIGGMENTWPFLNSSYGVSKASVNYLVRKLHFENPSITTLAINPGAVKTAEALRITDVVGAIGTWIEVDESARCLMEQIEKVTREHGSGSFVNYDGAELPW